MIYTQHLTITNTDLHELLAVPNGYICSINYIFVANHDNSTNSVDLYWDKVKVSESTVPSPNITNITYSFTSPASDVYLEVRKNTVVLDNPSQYSVNLATKTVTLVDVTASGDEITISHLEPQVYIFDGTNVGGGEREILGGQSSLGIFALHEKETVKVKTSAAANVEAAVTFELIEKPAVLVSFNGS